MSWNSTRRVLVVVGALLVGLSMATSIAVAGDDGGLLDGDDDDELAGNTTDTLESTSEETLESDGSTDETLDSTTDETLDSTDETLDSTDETLTDDSMSSVDDSGEATESATERIEGPSADQLMFGDLPDADELVAPGERDEAAHYADGQGASSEALGITESAQWGVLVTDERIGAAEYAAATDGDGRTTVLYTTGTVRHQEPSADLSTRADAADRRLEAGANCETVNGQAPCAYQLDGVSDLLVELDTTELLDNASVDSLVNIGRLPDNADALIDL